MRVTYKVYDQESRVLVHALTFFIRCRQLRPSYQDVLLFIHLVQTLPSGDY
jgi:hypothetical protein